MIIAACTRNVSKRCKYCASFFTDLEHWFTHSVCFLVNSNINIYCPTDDNNIKGQNNQRIFVKCHVNYEKTETKANKKRWSWLLSQTNRLTDIKKYIKNRMRKHKNTEKFDQWIFHYINRNKFNRCNIRKLCYIWKYRVINGSKLLNNLNLFANSSLPQSNKEDWWLTEIKRRKGFKLLHWSWPKTITT